MTEWLMLLVFYPSLALGASIWFFFEGKEVGLDHGERMYELGKRHGRAEVRLELYELSLKMEDDEEEPND